MGISANATLAYGYNLGGFRHGWKIREADASGRLPDLPWYNPAADDDVIDAAERHLLAEIAGFTETREDGKDGYYLRERQADDAVGVEFRAHCSYDCPQYLLAAHIVTVDRGDVAFVDPDDLIPAGWDLRLRRALEVLGITPTQRRAQWLLSAYVG